MLTRNQRQQLVRAAERLRGTPYDNRHTDEAWRNLHAPPAAFDCSTFVCRVAMEALGFWPDQLVPSAAWLLDNLVEVASPQLGDLVGYGRAAIGNERATYDVVWHVMMYCGVGRVIGACDIAGAVTVRSMEYEPRLANRQWRAVEPTPFRALAIRGSPTRSGGHRQILEVEN